MSAREFFPRPAALAADMDRLRDMVAADEAREARLIGRRGYRLIARDYEAFGAVEPDWYMPSAVEAMEADKDAARPDADADFRQVPAVSLREWLAGLHPVHWIAWGVIAAASASIAWQVLA